MFSANKSGNGMLRCVRICLDFPMTSKIRVHRLGTVHPPGSDCSSKSARRTRPLVGAWVNLYSNLSGEPS
ncbi:hypothetical protein BDZ89DRAFT_1067452 [Hymenopellis radicata]|nr:hypothetical protein BDZ89DRAFT_1067452 [Hymenopellis radicata]